MQLIYINLYQLGLPLELVSVLVMIETFSYLAKALSSGLRLTANMIGGHVLLKIFLKVTWCLNQAGVDC